MFNDVSNANRTKYSIKRKQENYTYWKYHKDLGRKSVLILLAHYQSQTKKMVFVKIVRSGLNSLLFSFLIFILFLIYFHIFDF